MASPGRGPSRGKHAAEGYDRGAARGSAVARPPTQPPMPNSIVKTSNGLKRRPLVRVAVLHRRFCMKALFEKVHWLSLQRPHCMPRLWASPHSCTPRRSQLMLPIVCSTSDMFLCMASSSSTSTSWPKDPKPEYHSQLYIHRWPTSGLSPGMWMGKEDYVKSLPTCH